jgi:ribonuclease-3
VKPLEELEQILGYSFRNRSLLEEALTHASYRRDHLDESSNDYQRLEFLGDAVLNFLLADIIFERYPDMREGEMTKTRSTLTQGRVLTAIARQHELHSYIRTGAVEEKSGISKSAKIKEDVIEALIGAIYKDGGIDAARRVALNLYGDFECWKDHHSYGRNPKGDLQEIVQSKHSADVLEYVIVNQEGPSHNRVFTVQALLNGTPIGTGSGKSRKEADQNAASDALQNWVPLRKNAT